MKTFITVIVLIVAALLINCAQFLWKQPFGTWVAAFAAVHLCSAALSCFFAYRWVGRNFWDGASRRFMMLMFAVFSVMGILGLVAWIGVFLTTGRFTSDEPVQRNRTSER